MTGMMAAAMMALAMGKPLVEPFVITAPNRRITLTTGDFEAVADHVEVDRNEDSVRVLMEGSVASPVRLVKVNPKTGERATAEEMPRFKFVQLNGPPARLPTKKSD